MTSPLSTRWYFGWNIVAASALLTLLTVGMRMSVGPFFLPIVSDLGFSRSLLSTIIAAGMLAYGVAMPVAGYLVTRWGTRAVLALGAVIVFLSSLGSVLWLTPLGFFLTFGVGLSIGLGFTSPVALTPMLTRWFVRRRGMALFFLSTGSMAGIAVLTPALSASIAAVGWQTTLVGFAALFLLVVVPTALFVIRDNAPPEADRLPAEGSLQAAHALAKATEAAKPTRLRESPASVAAMPESSLRQPLPLSAAVVTLPFWQILAGMFACGYSMNLLGTHGVPMLVDHGYDPTTGAMGIGLIGLVAIFSTLVLGRISDLWPRRHLLAAIYGVRGLGFFALLLVGTQWELYAAATVGGIVWAGSIALSSAILADVYGVRLVGVLYGLAYFSHQVGAAISSWLGGWGYEQWGSHWPAFGSAGALLLVAAAVSARLPRTGFALWRQPAVAGGAS